MNTGTQNSSPDSERQASVSRYLRFVIAFLLIMFGVLAAYEFYYGAEARKLEELQRQYEAGPDPSAGPAATENTQ